MSRHNVPMVLECADRELEDFNEEVVDALEKLGYWPHSVGFEISATHESILIEGFNKKKTAHVIAAEMHKVVLDNGWRLSDFVEEPEMAEA